MNAAIISGYLRYLWNANSAYKIHSPFVFDLYTRVIRDKTNYADYDIIELRRKHLQERKSLIETTDFGTGASSRQYVTRLRSLGEITRHSSVEPMLGRLLYRLVKDLEPEKILEIGTSVGISAMYMGLASTQSRIVSMEGCASVAEIAQKNFSELGIMNVELIIGNFDTVLGPALKKAGMIDFIFIDGNHREESTIDYFNRLLPYMHPGSMVVIDDINWSRGMQAAWKNIKARPEVRISIDLFRAGILLFRENIAKQDFVLRF